MNERSRPSIRRRPTGPRGDAAARIRRRYAAERRFRLLGLGAILLSAGFLAFLLFTMMANGARGFTQTEVRLDIDFPKAALFLDPATLRGDGGRGGARRCRPEGVVAEAAEAQYGPKGAGLFADTRLARVRDAIADDPAILTRAGHLLAARLDRHRHRRQERRQRRGRARL